MEFKTCKNCRVVLDVTGVNRDPEDYKREDGYDETKTTWDFNRHSWVVYTKCPVCGEQVLL